MLIHTLDRVERLNERGGAVGDAVGGKCELSKCQPNDTHCVLQHTTYSPCREPQSEQERWRLEMSPNESKQRVCMENVIARVCGVMVCTRRGGGGSGRKSVWPRMIVLMNLVRVII